MNLQNLNFIGLFFYSYFVICWSFSNNWKKSPRISFRLSFTSDQMKYNKMVFQFNLYRKIATILLFIFHVLFYFKTVWYETFILLVYGLVFSAIVITFLDRVSIYANGWRRILISSFLAAIGMYYFMLFS
jgi:hypothetical protein